MNFFERFSLSLVVILTVLVCGYYWAFQNPALTPPY